MEGDTVMRKLAAVLLGVALAVGASAPAWAQTEEADALEDLRERVARLEDGQEHLLNAYWRDGLVFDGENHKVRIGGRIHLDFFQTHRVSRNMKAVDSDSWKPAAGFRDLRLMTKGYVAPEGDLPIEYKLELMFRAEVESRLWLPFGDVYMGLPELPHVGRLRVGYFKEPFSLEQLTSANDLTFVERSVADALVPARNLGVAIGDTAEDEMIRWDFGLFRGFERAAKWKATARVAASPMYENEGEQVLHVGLAGSLRRPDDETLRFSQWPESSFAPEVVDTNMTFGRPFGAKRHQLLGAEAAVVQGPFSAQAEYMAAFVEERDAAISDDLIFHGGYVYASYFLTPGDRRQYSRSTATFGRVRPVNNFGDNGFGAVEVGARLSFLSLTNNEVRGGTVCNTTLGVNWYLNPVMKVMLNQVFTNHRRLNDSWTTVGRFQVAF